MGMRVLTVLLWVVLGCGSPAPSGDPVELATGVHPELPERSDGIIGCRTFYNVGLLIVDPEYGTAAEDSRGGVRPLIWPVGYAALRLAAGEVVVLDRTGEVVATTGQKYQFWAGRWSDDRMIPFHVSNGCVNALSE